MNIIQFCLWFLNKNLLMKIIENLIFIVHFQELQSKLSCLPLSCLGTISH